MLNIISTKKVTENELEQIKKLTGFKTGKKDSHIRISHKDKRIWWQYSQYINDQWPEYEFMTPKEIINYLENDEPDFDDYDWDLNDDLPSEAADNDWAAGGNGWESVDTLVVDIEVVNNKVLNQEKKMQDNVQQDINGVQAAKYLMKLPLGIAWWSVKHLGKRYGRGLDNSANTALLIATVWGGWKVVNWFNSADWATASAAIFGG